MSAPAHHNQLVLLPPNRVWRTYQGGRLLDIREGKPDPADTHFPEDWIASTTRAVNPTPARLDEGLSTVLCGGESVAFAELLARDPKWFFGEAHLARHGTDLRLLVKLLDPSIRLHFQVHPTAEFAQRFLNSRSGKTEAYHVISTRPEIAAPHIYLGFARPPTRDALRDMIERQDIAALKACFDPIPVKPGDTYVVPGGVPHALGAGVFLVEIQEPSDLVVRCEFERGGYVLPESARFMGRGLEFCLNIFDLSPWSAERVQRAAACPPRRRRALGPDSWQDDLIGPERTPCFRVRRSEIRGPAVRPPDGPGIVLVTAGRCRVQTPADSHDFVTGDAFFIPAGLPALTITPDPTTALLECYPPA